MIAYVRLARPFTCIASGITVLVGSWIAGYSINSKVVAAALAAALIAAAGDIFNDVLDKNADVINKPERPIPSGRASSKVALGLAFILMLISFSLSLYSGWMQALILTVVVLLLIAYSQWFKKIPFLGNLIIAVLGGVLFIFYGNLFAVNHISLAAGCILAIGVFGREILKTVPDVRGDSLNGTRTVTVIYGEKVSKGLYCYFALLFILLTLLFGVWAKMGLWFLVMIILLLIPLFLVRSYWLIRKGDSKSVRLSLATSKYSFFIWVFAVVVSKLFTN